MSKPPDPLFSRPDLLKECWQEQRQEIAYRRDREQLIFQTSATIWIGLLGALLINGQGENPFLRESGKPGRVALSLLVFVAAYLTSRWIAKQREARVKCQRALVEIQKQCGCFEEPPVLPIDFHDDWAETPLQKKTPPAESNSTNGTSSDGMNKKRKGSFKYLWSWVLPIAVIIVIWVPFWNSDSSPSAKPTTTNSTNNPVATK